MLVLPVVILILSIIAKSEGIQCHMCSYNNPELPRCDSFDYLDDVYKRTCRPESTHCMLGTMVTMPTNGTKKIDEVVIRGCGTFYQPNQFSWDDINPTTHLYNIKKVTQVDAYKCWNVPNGEEKITIVGDLSHRMWLCYCEGNFCNNRYTYGAGEEVEKKVEKNSGILSMEFNILLDLLLILTILYKI